MPKGGKQPSGGGGSGSSATFAITGISPDSGKYGDDGLTNVTDGLVLTGTATSDSTVTIYIDGVAVGTVVPTDADGDGTYDWSFDLTDETANPDAPASLADGTYQITASVDTLHPKSGKVVGTTTTEPYSLTIDTQVDPASGFTGISNDTGFYNDDGITQDTTPTVSGVTEAGATVHLIAIGLDYVAIDFGTATADANGNWSLGVTDPMDDGLYLLQADITDLAGNQATSYGSLWIDTTTPDPIVTAAEVGTGGVSDISGMAEAASTVLIFDGTTQIGTAEADANGNWTLIGAVLADGDHQITVRSEDLAGNVSGDSDPFPVTVDTTTDPPPPPPPPPPPDAGGATYTPDDPLYADQWHLAMIGNIERIWAEYSGAGVSVGIYDNGVEYTHPDLAANYDASKHVTVNGEVLDPWIGATAEHGTAVAGVIAAVDNSVGGVGVAFGASITGVNIFSGPADINAISPDGYAQAIAQAWTFDVINNSWGAPPDFNNEADLATFASLAGFETAVQDGRGGLGTIIVKAAGNDSDNAQGDFLNTSRYTIVVAAHDADGDASWYTNRGANLLVSAPSNGSTIDGDPGIVTTDKTGSGGYDAGSYTTQFGGTSSATPVVSGVVALMLEANPDLGWRDVQSILAYSAHFLGGDPNATALIDGGYGGAVDYPVEFFEWFTNGATDWNGGGLHFSEDYGFGGVDAYAAVRMAEVWSLFAPAQTSTNEIVVDAPLQYAFQSFGYDGMPNYTEASFTYTPEMAAMSVEYVEVYIDFHAAAMSEISIDLISPDGTVVSLLQAVDIWSIPSTDPDYYKSTNGYLYYLPGSVTWTYGATAFLGEDAYGDWTVRLTEVVTGNGFTGDGATLNSFQFSFYGAVADQDDVYHYTYEALTLGLYDDPSRVSLDDSGGVDWFDFSASAGDIVSDMAASGITTLNGITIVQTTGTTVIENAVAGDGADTLLGNDADNDLYGMRGADTLNGGLGDDDLWGGTEADLFQFIAGGGQDVIWDFELDGGDVIGLYGFGYTDYNQLTLFDLGADTLIDLSPGDDGSGDQITLSGIDIALLDASDFVFV